MFAILGYLPKLKTVMGLLFTAYFPHTFSMKMFLINALSNYQVSIFFQRSLVDQDVTIKTGRFVDQTQIGTELGF